MFLFFCRLQLFGLQNKKKQSPLPKNLNLLWWLFNDSENDIYSFYLHPTYEANSHDPENASYKNLHRISLFSAHAEHIV